MVGKNKNSKIKRMLRNGLASALICIGGAGNASLAYGQDPNMPKQENRQESSIQFPEKLTQEGQDFYKDPHKEFEFYRNTYRSLAEDRVIDSNDVASLESVLVKTLEEIDGKIYNQHGALRDSIPSGVETKAYLKFLNEMKKDLNELGVHSERKEKWSNTNAAQGKFWHYGSGLCFYGGEKDNGNTGKGVDYMAGERGLPQIFIDNPVYKISDELLLGGEGFKVPEVPELSDEIPAKTRFNYWLGLLGSLAIPGLSILGSSKLRKRKFDGGDIAYSILNPATGFILLDSIHPVVYPIRLLAFPAIYETARWIGSEVVDSNKRSEQSSDSRKNTEDKKTQDNKTDVPELPTDFIDPWQVDISNKDGGR